MKYILRFLFLLLTLTSAFTSLRAQESYRISENYKGLSFKEFVTKTESSLSVKFFYKEEWVKDLKLGDYKDCQTLQCVLNNLLKETSIYYYIDDLGNVFLTSNYTLKVSDTPVEKNDKFLPPTDYSGSGETQKLSGNVSV